MKKLKVGIIGLGVGEKHIKAYNSHPACEVAALCDFSRKRLSKTAREYPGVAITGSADKVLSDPDIKIVSIASFDNYHFQQVIKAIENEKHVFVEKPLCLYRPEAIRIRRLLDKKPYIKISSNLNLRTYPMFKWLKKAISSGRMGRVYYIEADYLWGRLNKLTNGWRKEMDFYSIVYGAAIHMIDIICWLTGKTAVEVKGYGNRISTQGSGFKYDDFASILIKFEDGTIAKATANGGCVHPHFHKLLLYGTKRTFMHDINGAKLLSSRNPQSGAGEKIDEEYPGRDKSDVIHSFVSSIMRSDSKPVVTTDDVFNTMSVCFAAEKAIKAGKSETVKYI